ncbi:MAG: PHP domain-containing protein [Parasporobacterium sp.]|nr:PHP domain-containing protein [Parasporobacterium sp.]
MGYIDLHSHTTASDGSFTPDELVKYACEKGLSTIAITDHDTVAGIPAAMSAARSCPVDILPGVEVSSILGNSKIHILGYGIDYDNPKLTGYLNTVAAKRDERNMKICSQLRTYGVDIDYDDFMRSSGCRTITRTHLAQFLINNGYAADKAEAMDKYLGKGRPCYIPMSRLMAEDAIKLIRSFGGVAVLAHPMQYKQSDSGLFMMMNALKDMGLTGVEAVYSTHTHDDEMKFREMADALHFIVTGGSDCHGDLKPDIDLGTGKGNLMIPQTLLRDMGFSVK